MRSDGLSLRVLVVGCGSIGQRHARNLRRLNVEDVLAYDPRPERLEEAVSIGGVQGCGSLEEAYARRPNAALICTPTSLHLDLARQALGQGCHVFVEKPIAAASEGVDVLLQEAEARGRVVMTGYHLRFDELLRQLESWLRDERLGRVVSARLHFGSYLPWRHPWEDYREGYGAQRSLGGGVILDAIHEIDYALWLFGRPGWVYCSSGTFGDLEIDVEDVAEITLGYPDRVVSVHVDYLQRPHRRWCEVIGTRGQIQGDLVERTLRLYDGETRQWQLYEAETKGDEAYLRELEHFLHCLANGSRPIADGVTALQSLLIAEAAKRSAQIHRAVSVN